MGYGFEKLTGIVGIVKPQNFFYPGARDSYIVFIFGPPQVFIKILEEKKRI
jgi:hypothetical protein